MASPVDIANIALAHLGNLPIGALDLKDPQSKAERLAATFIDQSLDYILKLQGWSDAKTRARLAAGTKPPVHGYAFSYEVPSDLVLLVHVTGGDYHYESRHILSNAATAVNIQYNRRIEIEEAGPLLVDLIALRLAIMISKPIKASTTAQKELKAEFRTQLRNAALTDNFESARGASLGSNMSLARHGVPVEEAASSPYWRG